jgi:hypothetical protein
MARIPRQRVNPLNWQTPIVDPETGRPTLQFIQFWERMFNNEDGTNADLASKADKSTEIIAGTNLSGGGDLSQDRMLNVSGNAAGGGLQVTAPGLLGRHTAGAGPIEEIQLGTNLSFAGNVLNAAGGGGGGGSGLFFDSIFSDFSGTASSGAAATQGGFTQCLADTDLDSLVARFTTVAGATYHARVYEMSGATASDTVLDVLDNGVTFTAPSAVTLGTFRLDFSATVTLLEGKLYGLAVSRTDATATTVLPIGGAATAPSQPRVFPLLPIAGRLRIPVITPVVGSVNSAGLNGGRSDIAVIGDPGSIA